MLLWRIQHLISTMMDRIGFGARARYVPLFENDTALELVNNERTTTHSLVSYYSTRQSPRFLIEATALPALCENLNRTHPEWVTAILAEADHYLHEGVPLYSVGTFPLTPAPEWHRLVPGPLNDILYLVRPHRFGFAPILAQAALFDERYLEYLDTAISSWISYAAKSKKCWPYVSNLVVIYRLLALSWTWHFLLAEKPHREQTRYRLIENILKVVQADITFLIPRLGSSSPNNHLLADYFIGWFIHAFYAELAGTSDLSRFEDLWCEELCYQFYRDGGNFEHSVHYHELGCEMALFYWLFKRRNNETPPLPLESRIRNMLAFQLSLAGGTTQPWSIGDATEDSLLPLAPGSSWSTGAFLALDKALFRPQRTGPIPDDVTGIKAFWMLNGQLVPQTADQVSTASVFAFPDAGFFGLSEPGQGEDLLLRTGPGPGITISPGHMHADILSLYWRHGNEAVLTASGTYSYRRESKSSEDYRSYLRSPEAQSGLVIAQANPFGPMEGDFPSLDNGTRVRTRFVSDSQIGFWCEGMVQSDTVYHGYRRGLIRIPGRYTVVYDIFSSENRTRNKKICWQFAPAIVVERSEQKGIKIHHKTGTACFLPSPGLSAPLIHRGSTEPTLGWVSENYGDLRPAYHVAFPVQSYASVIALLMVTDAEDGYDIIITEAAGSAIIVEVSGPTFRDRFFVSDLDGTFSGSSESLTFKGGIIHAFESQGNLEKLSGLGIKEMRWFNLGLTETPASEPMNILYKRNNGVLKAEHRREY